MRIKYDTLLFIAAILVLIILVFPGLLGGVFRLTVELTKYALIVLAVMIIIGYISKKIRN